MKQLFLKTTFEFWIFSGIVLCCVATDSPTQAQIREDIRLDPSPSSEEVRSVVNSAIRIRKIPA